MERTIPEIVVSWTELDPGDEHPPLPACKVTINSAGGVWLETFGTEAEVHAYLRGLQAGSQMTGGPYLRLPLEIPRPR